MHVAMFTNSFPPQVTGVAKSVEGFTHALRANGHRVVVVAPTASGAPAMPGVIRIPAVENVGGTIFSAVVPTLFPQFARIAGHALRVFAPQVIHAHQPWMLGSTARSVAAALDVPCVFTYHTKYSDQVKHFTDKAGVAPEIAVDVAAAEFARKCAWTIAPSKDIAEMLRRRGVNRVSVLPTGVDPARFVSGNGARFRQRHGIPPDAFLVGTVGRLAPEKNLGFVAAVFSAVPADWRTVIVGDGPSRVELEAQTPRTLFTGGLSGDDLADAYCAMDAFVIASKFETQGMVVTEAMFCGAPTVALSASGVRDVVDSRNGVLVQAESVPAFLEALRGVRARHDVLSRGARLSAQALTICNTAYRMAGLYAKVAALYRMLRPHRNVKPLDALFKAVALF